MNRVGFTQQIDWIRERNAAKAEMLERYGLAGLNPSMRTSMLPYGGGRHGWQQWLGSLSPSDLELVASAVRKNTPPFDDLGQYDDGDLSNFVRGWAEWLKTAKARAPGTADVPAPVP
jgi:hypothetical protein